MTTEDLILLNQAVALSSGRKLFRATKQRSAMHNGCKVSRFTWIECEPSEMTSWGPKVECVPNYCEDLSLIMPLLAACGHFIQISIGQIAVTVRYDFKRGSEPLATGSKAEMAAVLCRAFCKLPEKVTV